MSPPATLPPPGWYRDPAGDPDRLRWWDGASWGASTMPAPGPPAWPAEQAPAPGSPGTGGPGSLPQPATSPRGLPVRALWWAVVGFFAGQVLGGALSLLVAIGLGVSTNHLDSSAPVLLAGEVGLWSGFLGACLVVSHRYGTKSLVTDLGLRFRPVDLAWGLLAAASALVLEAIVASAFSHTRYQGTNTQIITSQRHNSVGFVVVAVIVAAGAPFFEELFFRGLIRLAFRSRMKPPLAVVAQAVLFGLAHIQGGFGAGNLSIVVTITGVGLILGAVAERTGRLGAGMVGHGLFNLTATLLILL